MKRVIARIESIAEENFSISAIRNANTRAATGVYGSRTDHLEELVIEHLLLVREMRKLKSYEQDLVCCIAEGYTISEAASLLKIPSRSASRMAAALYAKTYMAPPQWKKVN